MEKISGILGSSPRLASVDLKDSPVRPGTPTFGRPVGVSSLAIKPDPLMTMGSTAPKAAGIQQEMVTWRSKEASQAAIAADMSARFFLKHKEPAPSAPETMEPQMANMAMEPVFQREIKSKPAGFNKMDEVSTFRSREAGAGIDSFDGVEAEPMMTAKSFAEMDFEEPSASMEPAELQQPEGLFPKGSFINRVA